MDNVVVTVQKDQGITLIIKGYEDHAASFDYDDVLQVILQTAQTDLSKRQSEKHRLRYEKEMVDMKYANASLQGCATKAASNLALYPR